MPNTPHQTPRNSLALLEAAHEHMAEHGLASAQIDPATVALAIHSPVEVADAEHQSYIEARLALLAAEDRRTYGDDSRPRSEADQQLAYLNSLFDGPESKASETDAMYILEKKTKELSRNTRRRRAVAGFAIGALASIGLMKLAIEADASSQDGASSEQVSADETAQEQHLEVLYLLVGGLMGIVGGGVSAVAGTRRKTHKIAKRHLKRAAHQAR